MISRRREYWALVNPRRTRHLLWLAPFLLGLLTYGCAQVTVKKVPTPTQYTHWTDDMQREADQIQGVRFYLPRPFVNVFESFPICSEVYLADGVISADGKYVILKRIRAGSGLAKYSATIQDNVAIPSSGIDAGGGKQQQSTGPVSKELTQKNPNEADGNKQDTPQTPPKNGPAVPTGVESNPNAPQQPPQNAAPPQNSTGPQTPPSTGITKMQATNDNGAFAYQPLRGNFDLVYMPDFEEQYAISDNVGLGNASFQINLGQGWSLQGINALSDNSALNSRIFNLIDTAMKLAESAATKGLSNLIPDISKGTVQAVGPVGKPVGSPGTNATAGFPVTLKITVMHYATKGLYPVIKPRELQERKVSTSTRNAVLDIFKSGPQIVTWASDFDPTAIQRAQQTVEQTGNFTIPRYPYQYLSFNTFRYIAVELVKSDSPPYNNSSLPDRTGTQGDVGAARTGEIVQLLKDLRQVYGNPDDQKPPTSDKGVWTSLADVLKSQKPSIQLQTTDTKTATKMQITNAVGDDQAKQLTITLAKPNPDGVVDKTAAMDEVIKLVNTTAKNQGVNPPDIANTSNVKFDAATEALFTAKPGVKSPTPKDLDGFAAGLKNNPLDAGAAKFIVLNTQWDPSYKKFTLTLTPAAGTGKIKQQDLDSALADSLNKLASNPPLSSPNFFTKDMIFVDKKVDISAALAP